VCKRPGCRRPTAALHLCSSDYRAALRRSRRGGQAEPTQSDWDLTSDGLYDEVAVTVAANGERLVRLCPTERLSAARLIIQAGGNVRDLQTRLGVNNATALALLRTASAGLQPQIGKRG
jgi:hypothetical protein